MVVANKNRHSICLSVGWLVGSHFFCFVSFWGLFFSPSTGCSISSAHLIESQNVRARKQPRKKKRKRERDRERKKTTKERRWWWWRRPETVTYFPAFVGRAQCWRHPNRQGSYLCGTGIGIGCIFIVGTKLGYPSAYYRPAGRTDREEKVADCFPDSWAMTAVVSSNRVHNFKCQVNRSFRSVS